MVTRGEPNDFPDQREIRRSLHHDGLQRRDLFGHSGITGQSFSSFPSSSFACRFQKDFEKYGVNIKVQFRDGERLHEMVRGSFPLRSTG